MTHSPSEIMKAAHRQARRMEFLGGPSYAVRFAQALRQMYAHARKPAADTSYRSNVVRDAMGIPVGAH
jgi:hypothetical protein